MCSRTSCSIRCSKSRWPVVSFMPLASHAIPRPSTHPVNRCPPSSFRRLTCAMRRLSRSVAAYGPTMTRTLPHPNRVKCRRRRYLILKASRRHKVGDLFSAHVDADQLAGDGGRAARLRFGGASTFSAAWPAGPTSACVEGHHEGEARSTSPLACAGGCVCSDVVGQENQPLRRRA